MDGIYAFAPNRATLGGTAYLVLGKDPQGNADNYLIDAPANDPDILAFIAAQGGVSRWGITHRGAVGEASALQAALQCEVWVQEQEAYLLPNVPQLKVYREQCALSSTLEALWTPGHSPGSACIYYRGQGGVLFTGRHLLPDKQGQLGPLRFSKTFHWPRQLKNVKRLQAKFSADTLAYICPAANTGFLRGKAMVVDAHRQLCAIDTEQLLSQPAVL